MEQQRTANVSLCMDAKQWARFEAKFAVEPNTGCWLWTAGLDSHGYGQFGITNRRGGHLSRSHRVIYEHFKGPIPDGLHLDHLCRQRCCVNPDHLEPVTNRENCLRGDTVPAAHAAKTHCKNGHAFTPGNTYRTPQGHRRCRECCLLNERRKKRVRIRDRRKKKAA